MVIELPSAVAFNPAGKAKPLVLLAPSAVMVKVGVPPETVNVREYG